METRNLLFIIFSFLLVVLIDHSAQPLDFQYHNNEELEKILRNFSQGNPGKVRTQLYSIGQTVEGNKLWVLSLTAAKVAAVGIPNIKLIGNMHGNEAAGREILLHLIEHLLDNYGQDELITWLLDNTRIHILPSLNPDGYALARQSCSGPVGRTVPAVDIDLNRNFPGYFHNNSRSIDWSVIESNSIRHWMENNTFILSAALHGGALVANYPFDLLKVTKLQTFINRMKLALGNKEEAWKIRLQYIESTDEKEASPTPDDDVFKHLANVYAKNHPTMHLGQPCPGTDERFENGTVNGAMWYQLEGGMGDYNYAYHGCMELTLEISCCKYPPADDLPTMWKQNKKPLLEYCKQALRGVTGRILDTYTGKPIEKATLTIQGRDMKFWSSKNTGEFWRILLPGKYEIKVEADGYYTKTRPFKVKDYGKSFPNLTYIEIKLLNSSIPTTPRTTTTITTTRTTTPRARTTITKHVLKNKVTGTAYSSLQGTEAGTRIVLPQIVSKFGELEQPSAIPIKSNSIRLILSNFFIVLWVIIML